MVLSLGPTLSTNMNFLCLFPPVVRVQCHILTIHSIFCFFSATSLDKGECLGGATLSLLHDRTFGYTGDTQAQELCLYLTKAASAPYFEILEKWIYRGIINDPYRYRFY